MVYFNVPALVRTQYKMKKILFIVNVDWFFVSHRLPIAKEAISQGYEVHIATSITDKLDLLTKNGLIVHNLNLTRGSAHYSLLSELWNFLSIIKAINPDLVHLVTIKPILLGGLAARLAGVPAIVSAVSGLGIIFSSNKFKYKFLRKLLYPFFRLAFNHQNQKIIFQNYDDLSTLSCLGLVSSKKSIIIQGSGVDLNFYKYLPEPKGVPVISFAARLLIDKGVEVFVNASKILQKRNISARFWLIGEPDLGNINSVSKKQLREWETSGLVEWLGYRKDIPYLFSKSNIITLPSFYGEGLPKVLIEAAACGRAVITTDHPGCRDAIESNKTGLLIPLRDSVRLADSICILLDESARRIEMGAKGRKRAEEKFDVNKVVAEHINIYKNLLYEEDI
jgi:glycosyltransferase involved in cell wall biosynthesis